MRAGTIALGGALVLGLPLAAETGAETGFEFVEVTVEAPDAQDRDGPTWPVAAVLSGPTGRYNHDVLGGLPAFGLLTVTARACGACRNGWEDAQVALPDDLVFEDTAPRLWDVTGDGRPEVVVVESHVDKGARLAVWAYPEFPGEGEFARLAVTPFIGTRHRWLAPAGAADFDGDGRIEIAYVDRPHLLAELVFVRPEGDRLVEVARLTGVTNHRIGDRVIMGGVRDCGQGPEVVALSPDWAQVLRIGWDDGPVLRGAVPYSDAGLADALACKG